MKTSQKYNLNSRKSRKGAIAALTALLLLAIVGLVACALDIGYIEMTRTQLQSVSDASSLAAGTELLPGLGYFKTKTPAQIATAAKPIAVEYAGYNRNAELDSSYVDDDRDVEFGKAVFDSAGCNCWKKTPASAGAPYYNYVAVTPRRDQAGSSAGDGPAPLFFARIFGIGDKSMHASSTAAILAAGGFRIPEGSDDTAPIMPFAFSVTVWDRFQRALAYYKNNPNVFTQYPNWNSGAANTRLISIKDVNGPVPTAPLFGDGTTQLMFDNYKRTDAGVVSNVKDGALELNIYPSDLGGTVDLGDGGNSTNELRRKITGGLDADDMANYPNNEINPTAGNPLTVGANPGISAGMKSALDDVVGQCKAIALYSTATGNGNNKTYKLVRIVSATVVKVGLTGNPKEVRVQRCQLTDNENAVPNTDPNVDMDNATIFTPLTLIR